ncbi:MAG TPA: DUF4961 domain-containing protein [Bacteroidales bacterium]
MKKLYKINIKNILLYSGLAVIIFLIQCALVLNGVDVPSQVNANDTATFVMHCGVQPRITSGTYTTKLIIGFLAPKGWNAGKNTIVSFTSPIGGETLSVIPAGQTEKYGNKEWPQALKDRYGIGGNLVDDVEWVVFQSAQAYTLNNNQDFNFDVVIKSKVSSENMYVKLGFYYGTSQEGVSQDADYNKSYFTPSCFAVVNGEGDLVDYCNPQLATVTPVSSLDNDIISITYDNSMFTTGLSNTEDIYFCGKAITTDGEELNVCEQTSKTKFTSIGGQKFRLDLWPRGFFNVDKTKSLAKIEYYFTDASGTVKVGYSNTSDPCKYTFKCPN